MAGLAILKIITHKAANNIISLAALLIAFSSLYVSKKSLDTSLSVDTFVKKTDLLINKNSALVELYKGELDSTKRLLSKTDIIISLSDSQLELNRTEQIRVNKNNEISDLVSIERLNIDCHKINNYIGTQFIFFFTFHDKFDKKAINDLSSELDSLQGIITSGLGNTFLNKYPSLHAIWRKAYGDLQELNYDINMEGSRLDRLITHMTNNEPPKTYVENELSPDEQNHFMGMYHTCMTSVMNAEYGALKIVRKELKKQGYIIQ